MWLTIRDELVDRIRKLPDDVVRELFERFDEILEDDARLAREAEEEGFVSVEEATRRLVESGKLPAGYLEKDQKRLI